MLVGSPRTAQLGLRAAAAASARLVYPRLITQVPRPAIQLYRLNSRSFTISQRHLAEAPNDPSKTTGTGSGAATATATTTASAMLKAVATTTSTATAKCPPKPPASSTPNPPPPRRRRRGIYYSTIFLLIGLSLGTLIRVSLAPPAPYPHGSPQDQYHVSKIRDEGSALPLVRALSSDPTWKSWDAYSGDAQQSATMVQSRLTSGPLGDSHGIPFQRVFRNTKTNEVVSVVYLGAATAGWPGVVHGGALATLLDESLVRCAVLLFPARTGVTARLELQYRAPTLTSAFYVIRARPMIGEGEDSSKSYRKMWVEGTLETLHGKICVEAKALAVVPKGVKLKPLVEEF
ncbi:HotDog domain-containing protein [Daldinia vernicosa]|uniref:HotDog domain-containing protein n=1 Tax=Daldinia vernicosa TaxID=114800 RepID=UPI00200892DD|nr:HotDog domain-containing protein [Daldinia vernicosa]KAI0847651.1 HotDog domain-containing protein [Daldinia vernicosa]